MLFVLLGAMKQVVADHGKLDILCNNAGVVDEDNWEKTIAINLVRKRRKTRSWDNISVVIGRFWRKTPRCFGSVLQEQA